MTRSEQVACVAVQPGSVKPSTPAETSVATPPRSPATPRRASKPRGSPSAAREVGLFAAALLLCPLVAVLAPGDPAGAVSRGDALADVERSLGLLVEPGAHAWVAERPGLLGAACVVYVLAHLPAVAGALVWTWLERPRAYPFARNLFLVAQGITVAGYLVVPTAPPRLVPGLGIADTLASFWGSGSASTAHVLQSPYAAFPSGHVVFALIAGGIVVCLARPLVVRALGAAYPVLVVAITIVTGNHFWLDAVGGAVVVVLAGAGVTAARRLRAARLPTLWPRRRLASSGPASLEL